MLRRSIILAFGLQLFLTGLFATGIEFWPGNETILTDDVNKVVSDEVSAGNGIESGLNAIVEGDIEGVYKDGITDTATAWEKARNRASGIINFALGLIGLVALVYILYHGFLVLTAGSDEEQSKAGYKGIRTALIAIFGIAFAWFLISLVFFFIYSVTDGV